ncbi:MAG: hypothetical protein M3498_04685 [Deinococcota bacterium]|nr:hypothetical protein [Deinococcota bacterium]
MASRQIQGGASAPSIPLDQLLSAIPSLPRPVLSRLTEHLIERLDQIDGDPDVEDSESGNHLVDASGQWCGRAPAPDGPWYEDDEPEEDVGAEEKGEDDGLGPDMRAIADRDAYREQLTRLHKERCFKLPRLRSTGIGAQEWVLYQEPATPTKRSLLRRKRGLPRSPRA